jgi:CheY-like chemotaxis protein
MFLVDESHLESVLNTKVKALYNEKMLLEKNESHLSRRKKVLYVSDNRFMHIIVKDVCLNHSIEFQEAFDAEEALKKLKTSVPDIVLTDMDIPGLTGLELCKAIKHSEAYGHIPVIIYSSHKKTDVYEACKAAGASAYYEKNMNPKDLFAKLEAYL